MIRVLASILITSAVFLASAAKAAEVPATWDGLVSVPSTRFDMVQLQPGADFSSYTKVILKPTEVAFTKDWLSNYNKSTLFPASRVSEEELQRVISAAVDAARDLFAQAWIKGGYAVVQEAGPDVLEVRTGVLNISVTTPAPPSAGRVQGFARETGRATFYIELRDSTSGALLGRAVDRKLVGDDLNSWRTAGSNRADFRHQVENWAKISVLGMNEIKSRSRTKP